MGDTGQEGVAPTWAEAAHWHIAKGPQEGSEEGVCSHLTNSGPLPRERGWGWALMAITLLLVPSSPPHSLLFSECLVYCSAFVKRGIRVTKQSGWAGGPRGLFSPRQHLHGEGLFHSPPPLASQEQLLSW